MNLRRTYARVLLKTLFPRTHLSVLALHTHGVFAKRVFCFDDTFLEFATEWTDSLLL